MWGPNAVGTPAEKAGVPVTVGAALIGLFGNDDIQYGQNKTHRIEVRQLERPPQGVIHSISWRPFSFQTKHAMSPNGRLCCKTIFTTKASNIDLRMSASSQH